MPKTGQHSDFEFPPELLAELQKHSTLPILTKDGCVEYARERGINLFRNAVHQSVTDGDLCSYLISGQALVSPRDLMAWLLSKRRSGAKRRSA